MHLLTREVVFKPPQPRLICNSLNETTLTFASKHGKAFFFLHRHHCSYLCRFSSTNYMLLLWVVEKYIQHVIFPCMISSVWCRYMARLIDINIDSYGWVKSPETSFDWLNVNSFLMPIWRKVCHVENYINVKNILYISINNIFMFIVV